MHKVSVGDDINYFWFVQELNIFQTVLASSQSKEISLQTQFSGIRYAKMWYKGVSFTSDQCALVYLVDSAGTRTTTDTFSDLSGDFSLGVFYRFPSGRIPLSLGL